MLKMNDFFCGCGGMGLAFQNAGFEIVGAWDIDKYAVQTYKANVWDGVQLADVKELRGADIPKADVWAFGFPCQDLSVAGKQKGMVLACESCGNDIKITAGEYRADMTCPACGGNKFKASSRSGCFFEIMRLLEEVEDKPPVIIAENVKGLKPYLPVLEIEYERHGYKPHTQLFNSKYWGVPQNRERYAVVGTRDGINFQFPMEQHEYIPRLSDYLDDEVDARYYIADDKAQTIIKQAMERLDSIGKCHATITPDRENKRQNGRRAKEEEEEEYTLTAQDIHGVIQEAGLLDPDGCGKTLRIGGVAGSLTKKHNYQHVLKIGNTHPSGRGMNGNVYDSEAVSPTLTTNKGEGIKVALQQPQILKGE